MSDDSVASRYRLSSTIELRNGALMPRIHLGVWESNGAVCETAVRAALECGYRAVDTAEWYENEAEVGAAIRAFLASPAAAATGLQRRDIWFTTKLRANVGYEETREAIRRSRRTSGLPRLDLYLLHSPYGGREKRLECWRAVEDAMAEGEVGTGGVSNFGLTHLRELVDAQPRVLPAVNQIEVNPFNTRRELTSFCQEHGIVVQAYSPLAKAWRMQHPKILELAQRYSCSPAQLLIRWSLQHDFVPLPKSANKERIRANGQLEGFDIGQDDMKVLDGLDEYLITDWDPTNTE
ncbi:MAG: hypothetical protein M1818_003641 [Claussenomyces sp. TS43310]|nr:MAG: hypothetical protein M1818_003641 [Claussenomyces sp. TS43310]